MKMMLMKLMIIMSSMVTTMKNPMSMGITLITQKILVTVFMNKISMNSWFTMTTFMMMIGGLLIMFMYMKSIASNEKFKFKINLMLLTLLLMMTVNEDLMYMNIMNENQETLSTNKVNFALTKMYSTKSMSMPIMLVMYLLVTMISVTKMVMHHKGPLRKCN